ncbi:unnamed protein product [Rotaria socialis]|uniref:Uncharacterized protein n=1 Tax=Rotaria socialis TaxID=392032 RepID=A0A820V1H6_9BILA|nr:unnamed protein product [Rotaria socialis]
MSCHHQHFLDLYCDLPNELPIAYSEPQYVLYYRQKNKVICRNTNATEPTFLVQPSKYKSKNLLHPYRISKARCTKYSKTSEKGTINKIMSIESQDHEVEFYMMKNSMMPVTARHSLQMADGDKINQNVLENYFDAFQQQRFTNDREYIIKMLQKDVIRPVPHKPMSNDRLKHFNSFGNSISTFSSSQIYESTLPINRISTWRKLQANITPFHYNRIQQFQQRYHSLPTTQPIMLSPLHSESRMDSPEASKIYSNAIDSHVSFTSVSIDSPIHLSDSKVNRRIMQLGSVDQNILDNEKNYSYAINPNASAFQIVNQSEIYPTDNIAIQNEIRSFKKSIMHSPSTFSDNDSKNDSNTNVLVKISSNVPLLDEMENIEKLTTFIELPSPSKFSSIVFNHILPSFPVIVSTKFISTLSSTHPVELHSYRQFTNAMNVTEILNMDSSSPQPSTPLIKSKVVDENHQSKKVHSLLESIEELCFLIRTLLQHERTDQKIAPLQTTIVSELAILLTHLATPTSEKVISESMTKHTIDRMISTDENDFPCQQRRVSTIETQTDCDLTMQLNDKIFWTEPIHNNLVDFSIQELSSFEIKQQNIFATSPSFQKLNTHTELTSTSGNITVHLPGGRPKYVFSDTFIYHTRHHQKYSSSCQQLISVSDTNIHAIMNSFHHHRTTKEEIKQLLKRAGQIFCRYVELESSNTCLEASTEFTPDFLLTPMNNLKNDGADNDQTEQFGIDTEQQGYETDRISFGFGDQPEKFDTLTFNSTEKENYDSLDLDIEQDHDAHPLFTSVDIHQSNQYSINHLNIAEDVNQLQQRKLLEPHLGAYQWQLPILARRTNSMSFIYEKEIVKINLKNLKISSNSKTVMSIIGKQHRPMFDAKPVRILVLIALKKNWRLFRCIYQLCCFWLKTNDRLGSSSVIAENPFYMFD